MFRFLAARRSGMPTSIFRFLAPLIILGLTGCGNEKDQRARHQIHAAGFSFTVDDFLRAARDGRQDVVLHFLTAGMNPDVSNVSGVTAVASAAAGGHGHVVALLLSRGARPDASSSQGQTALMAAAQSGDEQTVKALLAAGANGAVQDSTGQSPLEAAVLAGHSEIVALLVDRTPASLDHALELAAMHGHMAVISILMDRGASPFAAGAGGRTPLMIAAQRGQLEAAKMLRQRGACVTALDDKAQTAADYADANGHEAVAAYLREPDRSADPVEPELPPLRLAEVSWRGEPPSSLNGLVSQIEMMDFRSSALPIALAAVADDNSFATVRVLTGDATTVTVAPGDEIPGSGLIVEKVRRRVSGSRHNPERLVDTSEILVHDTVGGRRHLVLKNLPALTGEACALTKIPGVEELCEVRRGDEFTAGSIPVKVAGVRPVEILLQRTDTLEKAAVVRTGVP